MLFFILCLYLYMNNLKIDNNKMSAAYNLAYFVFVTCCVILIFFGIGKVLIGM